MKKTPAFWAGAEAVSLRRRRKIQIVACNL
jgi:hypothetical protein